MVTFAFHRGSPLNFLAVFKGPILVRGGRRRTYGKEKQNGGKEKNVDGGRSG